MYDYTESDNNQQLMNAIETKLSEIIKVSDLILFVVDGDIGITPNDKEIAIVTTDSVVTMYTYHNNAWVKIHAVYA